MFGTRTQCRVYRSQSAVTANELPQNIPDRQNAAFQGQSVANCEWPKDFQAVSRNQLPFLHTHLLHTHTYTCTHTHIQKYSSIHCALASGAVYCNRSCLFVCGCVGGSITPITRNCVHRSSPNWVHR